MAKVNAKDKALRTRRDQKDSKHVADPDEHHGTRQASSGTGSESLRVHRTYRKRSGQLQSERTTTGGILNRLISRAENQLVRIDAQLAQLQNEKQELESEVEQLKALLCELQKPN